MRTMVLPSCTAHRKSPLIPIDRTGRGRVKESLAFPQRDRSRENAFLTFDSSPPSGPIVINPSTERKGHAFNISSRNFSVSPGAIPFFDPSPDVLISRSTGSFFSSFSGKLRQESSELEGIHRIHSGCSLNGFSGFIALQMADKPPLYRQLLRPGP